MKTEPKTASCLFIKNRNLHLQISTLNLEAETINRKPSQHRKTDPKKPHKKRPKALLKSEPEVEILTFLYLPTRPIHETALQFTKNRTVNRN